MSLRQRRVVNKMLWPTTVKRTAQLTRKRSTQMLQMVAASSWKIFETNLDAQMMGLNTCWVAGTYSKGKCRASIAADEKLVCIISIGYGQTQGKQNGQ